MFSSQLGPVSNKLLEKEHSAVIQLATQKVDVSDTGST